MTIPKVVYQRIEWKEEINDIGIDCSLDIAIHRSGNGIILLIIPGVDGDVDGYDDKYKRIAEATHKKHNATVVRISNPFISSHHWESNVRQTIDFIHMNANKICGNDNFELRIMAHSAGAAIITQIAHEFPEISRLLLVNPALKLKPDKISDGLNKIKSKQVTVLIGSRDPSVGDLKEVVGDNADVIVIESADHHFSGEAFQIFLDSPHKYLFY